MFRQIDRNEWLINLLKNASAYLSRNRGLPMVVGVVLVIFGALIQIIAVYSDARWIDVVAVIVHNVGLLSALIGFLLAEPLGG
jgi:hypothetical protein